jgi:hypothetical protein
MADSSKGASAYNGLSNSGSCSNSPNPHGQRIIITGTRLSGKEYASYPEPA